MQLRISHRSIIRLTELNGNERVVVEITFQKNVLKGRTRTELAVSNDDSLCVLMCEVHLNRKIPSLIVAIGLNKLAPFN